MRHAARARSRLSGTRSRGTRRRRAASAAVTHDTPSASSTSRRSRGATRDSAAISKTGMALDLCTRMAAEVVALEPLPSGSDPHGSSPWGVDPTLGRSSCGGSCRTRTHNPLIGRHPSGTALLAACIEETLCWTRIQVICRYVSYTRLGPVLARDISHNTTQSGWATSAVEDGTLTASSGSSAIFGPGSTAGRGRFLALAHRPGS